MLARPIAVLIAVLSAVLSAVLIEVLRVGRQRQLQPLRDAVALHQDDLVLQRRQRIALHPFDDQIAQHLGLIAMHEHQAGGQGGQGQVGLRGRGVEEGQARPER
ncbi:MAG: hypothetical protein AW11_00876 [Candidatus Accumulibacter regalis]|uniref:Uncharacterized protein n=1 Tax=Accumulibacter regalis TaxID=522306 RepID=A0A011P5X0_ACCRE|nr:MAG: hypothetical protein AW11_00876 [Candidatus Accumulibacter regalis]